MWLCKVFSRGTNPRPSSWLFLRLAPTGLLTAGLLLSLSAPAATVQYLVSASDAFNYSGEAEPFGVPLGAGLSVTASIGSSRASMSVTPGMLRLRAESAWPASPEGSYGYEAEANVELTDTFILTAPPGSSVFLARLSATISVSGSVAQSGGGASWRSTALLSASPYRGPAFSLVTPWSEADVSGSESAAFGSSGASLPTTFTTTTPGITPGYTDVFIVGQPVAVRLTFSASAGCVTTCTSAGFARTSLEDTLIWLGITARDENGDIIEGLTFVSESGIDWGNPPAAVPLPATGWLLLAGVGAIAARARRRLRLRHCP